MNNDYNTSKYEEWIVAYRERVITLKNKCTSATLEETK